jgi:hypothetical protein
LPFNSPSSSKVRKDSNTTPTKLTAQRLQRIQNSPLRQGKTPKQSRPHVPQLSSIPNDVFGADTFDGMDHMIVDIFSDASSAANADSLFGFDASKGSHWPDWLPSDYVSPNGSKEEHNAADDDSGNLINALLSNSDINKENQFDIFNLADPNMLDSGFFSSDALNNDVMTLSVKTKLVEEPSHQQEAHNNTPTNA